MTKTRMKMDGGRSWAAALGVACGMALLIGGLSARTAAQTPRQGDEQAVVATMQAVYQAATHDDLSKLAVLLAPDFLAFDGGHRFEGMQLPEFIKQAHAAGKQFQWTVTKPDVHVRHDIAWITYENVGAVGTANEMKPQTWLESAVLKKQAGQWRVAFLHSTRVGG